MKLKKHERTTGFDHTSSRDLFGNLCFDFPKRQFSTRSILTGEPVANRLIITPDGQNILGRHRTQDFAVQLQAGILRDAGEKVDAFSTESDVFRISTKGNIRVPLFFRLFQPPDVSLALKYLNKADQHLLGVEHMDIYRNVILQAFHEHGLKVAGPIAATNNCLVVPWIEGATLQNLLYDLYKESPGGAIGLYEHMSHDKDRIDLHFDIFQKLLRYLEEMGFDAIYEQEKTGDESLLHFPTWLKSKTHDGILKLIIDTIIPSDDEVKKYAPQLWNGSLYRNWLVPPDDIEAISALVADGKIEQAGKRLSKQAVCIDPFLINTTP